MQERERGHPEQSDAIRVNRSESDTAAGARD